MVVPLYLYAIGILLAGVLNTLFGFSVYIKNRKNYSSRSYALLSLAFAVWCYSWFAMLLVKENETLALFFARFLNFGAVFIPALFFQWILSILGIEKTNKGNILACYTMTMFFAALSWTPLFVQGVHPISFFPYWPTAGFIYIFYLIFGYLTFPTYGLYLLVKKFLTIGKTNKIIKNQLLYVLLGSFMGLGGGALNFLLMYNINPFGQFFEVGMFIVLLAFVPFAVPYAYATMKYHLMDIKIVLTEMLAGLVAVTLLVDTVFSVFTATTSLVVILKFIVFIVFSYFSVMLVRSVLKEIEQREKIEKIEKELEQAYEVEKRAKEKLEELDSVKDQFLMTIQHHLRTPLTSMRGYSDLLLGGTFGKLPRKVKEVIERFEISTTGLIKMVNDFLDVTQFQLGKQVVSLKDGVNLSPILEEIVGDVKLEAEKKGIYLKLEKPEGACIIKADESKLKAALVNVFDNSVKYTQKGGVTMRLTVGINKVRVEVEDTGMGITKERLRKLFDSTFERTEESKKTFASGRGIGLYLASQIVKAHKGKIWAESNGEGKGSIFNIELPVR